jgi:uncharacterized protein DUF3426
MFFSCPHCHELVATDRETSLPPVMCPRCGGALREEIATVATAAPGILSIASLLQGPSLVAGAPPLEPVEADARVEAAIDAVSSGDTLENEVAAIVEDRRSETASVSEDEVATPASRSTAVQSSMQYPGPSFARQRAQPATSARTAKWQWAALVLLATTLVLQVLLADRARLAADASWRPLISSLCKIAGCSVAAWHHPGALVMLSRDVSPIPGTAGGLDVRVTFRNDARWPQAWPVLLLSLSDADGRVLGSRAFLPEEYLGAAATQTELAPGQSAQIGLKLHEPNPDVAAFAFEFH